MMKIEMKRFGVVVGLILVLSVGYSGVSFAAPGKEKFATVDIGKIFDEFAKTKKYDQEFQVEGVNEKNGVLSCQKQIQ